MQSFAFLLIVVPNKLLHGQRSGLESEACKPTVNAEDNVRRHTCKFLVKTA